MVINFFGKRGSGKTTAIRGNIKYYRTPVVIVDILGNFGNDKIIQVESIPDAVEALEKYYSERDKYPLKGGYVLCLKTSDPAVAADYLSAVLWEINGGTLVLDEVDSISIEEGSCFDQFIRYGRNHNGDIVTGCRRPAEISRNLTAAASKFYCFQTTEPRDVEYFDKTIFGERAQSMISLPKYSGLFVDHELQLVGQFKIDICGNIFHTSQESA